MNNDSSLSIEPYQLFCPICEDHYPDTYLLSCPKGCNSLLRAQYRASHLTVRNLPGLFKFSDWLPVKGFLPTRSAPICYKSIRLARHLGLSELFIVFCGYWPEKEAYVTSGSFKEFEAFPTIVRLRERTSGVILVSSAGNTGRAFAQVSAETGQPVIVVVPSSAQDRIWTTLPAGHLLLITVNGDYTDAITLGNFLSTIPGIYSEGGAKNIARRDGMGTVMLEGTIGIGRLPDWYVQAVGSGTGGIAAWEAAIRLVADGRYGESLPRLMLIQNDPFIPMVRAFEDRRRDIIPDIDMPDSWHSIQQVYSDLLTNRTPPYGIAGGVYDALVETNGHMDGVTTDEARIAGELFLSLEGTDIDPAAAVCVAGLIKKVQEGIIGHDDTILLAITGGGYCELNKQVRVQHPPDIYADNLTQDGIINQVTKWVSQYV